MAIFCVKTSVLKKLLFFGFPTAILLYFYSLPLEYSSHFKTLGATEERQHRPGFLVDTIGCEIVEMDPFHPSVIPFLKNKSLGICRPSLITIRNEGLAYNENHSSYHRSNCCYSEIHRASQDPKNYTKNQADWSVRISPTCTPISKSSTSTTTPSSDFVRISCEENYLDQIIETMDFLAIPGSPEGHSKETNSKVAYWKDRLQKSGLERGVSAQKPPNVLILGIDSVSRLNMIRSLPKLKTYLEANDFVEMKGYTKVGENTFPNMMAALGGMKLDEYPCILPEDMLDNCPFIWKNYSGNKYVTAILEDDPNIAGFNYQKTGFVKQPVDYYLRTLAVAHYQAKLRDSCQNGMSQTEFLMNYLRNLVRRIANANAPYFLLSWFTALTHDDSNNLKPAEMIFYKALSDLVMDGSFHGNNTIILITSDHGFRYGNFRETFMGYYEVSLPFFFMRLPASLRLSHPHWNENLKKNSHRLTTPLDLHATLEDILGLSDDPLNIQPRRNTLNRTTYSLFEEIPLNRTCKSSGISEDFCRCGAKPPVSTTPSKEYANFGDVIIAQVNNILLKSRPKNACISLIFQKLLYSREISNGTVWNDFGKFIKYVDHVVAIEAVPSGANFEARMRVFENETIVIVGEVSRINSYGEQGNCVKDYTLQKYCYCWNYSKHKTNARNSIKQK